MTPEERLLKDITKRLQQSFLDRTTEAEIGEAVHQNIAIVNTKWIALHNRKLEQITAFKELIDVMIRDWEAEEKLLDHAQATEGHAYEAMADSQKVLHDWNNIQTVLDNMAAVYQARLDELEADAK